MKDTQVSVDRNVVIWGILKGDHACGAVRKMLNSQLLLSPDFESRQENGVRLGALRAVDDRRPFADAICRASFQVKRVESADLDEAITVFSGNPKLGQHVADADAAYREDRDLNAEQTHGVVRAWRTQRVPPVASLPDIDPQSDEWLYDATSRYDYHRSLWFPLETGNYQIVDGTHRMIGVAWYLLSTGKSLSNLPALYAIVAD